MEKMHATTSIRDRQKMIEEIDMEAKEEDPATTTTTAPTAKWPQDTKTTAIKGATAKARGIETTEKRTTKNSKQENPESTTHRQKTC
jgi:hypothetical protein